MQLHCKHGSDSLCTFGCWCSVAGDAGGGSGGSGDAGTRRFALATNVVAVVIAYYMRSSDDVAGAFFFCIWPD